MRFRRSFAYALALVLAATMLAASPARAGDGQTQVPLIAIGIGTLDPDSGDPTGTDGTTNEFSGLTINPKIPHSGLQAARVPADHVPAPVPNAIASANPGASGFDGLDHRDQRFAGTDIYVNTQFSLEPPDQGLCVGNGFVLEVVNTALRVFSTGGATLTGTTPINQFFGLAPEVIRSAPRVFGDFTSDPKCYFDAPTGRFFLTVLQLDVDPSTGVFAGRSHLLLAVSRSGDPTAEWHLFSIDSTNDGQNGTPSHTNCPCLGDQPLIGADANGFYISTNEFGPIPTFGFFNGAQIYALSKSRLVAGTLGDVVLIDASGALLAQGGSTSFSVQPATTPPGGVFAPANRGTEFFLSTPDFRTSLDNRLAVWALTNTSSLESAAPNLVLKATVIASEVYGVTPAAQQKDGPLVLANFFGQPAGKLELLDTNDQRMNQVVFAADKLWSAVGTVVKAPNGFPVAGIAYFVLTPSVAANGTPSGTIAAQGYVSVNGQSLAYPSIGVTAGGKAIMGFTLVGPDFFPSAAYTAISVTAGAGDVHLAGAGAGPEDGFTGYAFFGSTNRVARWGDYSAAVADAAGNVWLAAEYITPRPRSFFANWGTFVTRLAP